ARRSLPDSISNLTEYFPTKEDIRWRKWLKKSYTIAQQLYDGKAQIEISGENDILRVISRSRQNDAPEKSLDYEEALAQLARVFCGNPRTQKAAGTEGDLTEAMRLHPIVSTLLRQADVDDVIPLQYPVVSASGEILSEIPVVKEQRIMVSVGAYNRLKEVWGEDADEWNPSRFLDTKRQTMLGVFGNLMTFGAGVRACLGIALLAGDLLFTKFRLLSAV
ncbi:hypothetical protein MPER_09336, partial [Moniliophthora perniciosa FA553]